MLVGKRKKTDNSGCSSLKFIGSFSSCLLWATLKIKVLVCPLDCLEGYSGLYMLRFAFIIAKIAVVIMCFIYRFQLGALMLKNLWACSIMSFQLFIILEKMSLFFLTHHLT